MITTISKGQQITIPVEIRAMFGLDIGSRIEIIPKKDEIVIKPIGKTLEEVFEKAKKVKAKKHLTAEEMDELNERMFR